MSEERQRHSSILLKIKGKKLTKIEAFPAIQWKRKWRYGKKMFNPKPRKDPGWWEDRFRIRINGVWHSKGNSKYTFLTIDEIRELTAGKIII